MFITHDEAQVKSQSVYFVNPRGSYVKKKKLLLAKCIRLKKDFVGTMISSAALSILYIL